MISSATSAGARLLSFKRSQFGGMVSGPIKKDRTFFMGSFEGLRQRSFASTTTTVPTALERAGDFSKTFAANGQVIQIYDPFSTRAEPERNRLYPRRFPRQRYPGGEARPGGA